MLSSNRNRLGSFFTNRNLVDAARARGEHWPPL
jgi:hypothetical protein